MLSRVPIGIAPCSTGPSPLVADLREPEMCVCCHDPEPGERD